MGDSGAPAVTSPWRVLAVGVLAGVAAGLFGVGGGIVIVPGLALLAGLTQRHAHATSLAAIVVIAASGAVGYALAGQVRWGIAAVVAAGTTVGALAGTRMLQILSERVLARGFALLMVLAAIRMVVRSPTSAEGVQLDAVLLVLLVVLGLVAGTVSGLMGIGGGVIIVPVLALLVGLSLVSAKGTSLAVIAPTALVGSLRNVRGEIVHARDAALVAIGGIGAAAAASQLSLGLDPVLSSWLFAGLLVVAAVRLW